MKIALITLCSFSVAFAAIYALIRISATNGFGLDMPGRRKVHKPPTPRLAGVAILLGLLTVLPVVGIADRTVLSYLLGCTVIFAVGLWDDIKGVKWPVKMAGIFTATAVTVFYGAVVIEDLGNLLGYGVVELGVMAVPFTFFSVLGIVSAVNMIDGINGLAGGVAMLALLVLAYFSHLAGDSSWLLVNTALAASVLAFLIYNYPRGKIFLGDSGSSLLGFSIATASITLFQGKAAYEPMVPVLILALPILDTLRVMTGRILRLRNPFRPDQSHLHHIMLHSGVAHEKISPILWVVSLAFALSAIALKTSAGWLMLFLLICSYALLSLYTTYLTGLKSTEGSGLTSVREK